jgi:hypothetical protein
MKYVLIYYILLLIYKTYINMYITCYRVMVTHLTTVVFLYHQRAVGLTMAETCW